MSKYRVPDTQEEEILRRNKIDPDTVMVGHRSEDAIYLLNSKTRDMIIIRQGDKKW